MDKSDLVESRIAEIFGGRRRRSSKKASKKASRRGGQPGGLTGGRRRRRHTSMKGGQPGLTGGQPGGRRRRVSKKASRRGGQPGLTGGQPGGRRRASKKVSKKGSKKMKRGLNPKMAKYQELTKLVREHSTDKGVVAVSKVTKKVRDEAIKAHPNKDFMEQIDAAKALFKANPKKYL